MLRVLTGRSVTRRINPSTNRVFLSTTQQVRHTHSTLLSRYFARVFDNPLPLGAGALVVGLLQLRRIRERDKEKQLAIPDQEVEQNIPPTNSEGETWQVTCYKSLPLRHVSRAWGAVNSVYLPVSLRPFILGTYARAFGCDLTEAEEGELTKYENLGQFFRRGLKAGCRPIDPHHGVVSPCDGRVLHQGEVERSGWVEQVKGVTYRLDTFLGPGGKDRVQAVDCKKRREQTMPWINNEGEENNKDAVKDLVEVNASTKMDDVTEMSESSSSPSTKLFQCVFYLAPGDYHRFHSPVDWVVETRRHFPGELLSVSPKVAASVPGLFSLNERVAYLGRWKHGFFSLTAVGATNVGSVRVEFDPKLSTNTGRWERDTFHQHVFQEGVKLIKGDPFGEFNLGSTIVLVFEAPADFRFSPGNIPGCVARVGGAVGDQIQDQQSCLVVEDTRLSTGSDENSCDKSLSEVDDCSKNSGEDRCTEEQKIFENCEPPIGGDSSCNKTEPLENKMSQL